MTRRITRRRGGEAAWWLCVLAPACLGIACNQLLGIEKAELEPLASGGSSSTGGTNGGGGSHSGGGDGGTCSAYDVGNDELVRGCLMRVSCDPAGAYYTMSQCVSYSYQLTNAYEACTYGASSCGDVEECLGRRAITPASCGGTSGWSCSGDEAVLCGVPFPYAWDCGRAGAIGCYGSYDFPTQGPTAPCLLATDTCYDAPGEYHCAGNVLYECIGGQPYGVDCTGLASTCVETGPGEAMCIDSTTQCTSPGTLTCRNDVLSYCGETGILSAIDCAAAGLRCETSGDYAECVAPSCSVDDVAGCSEGCNGTRLQFCVGGSPSEVDCAEFGFARCEATEANGFTWAFCVGDQALEDSCEFAFDGECDMPPVCDEGTDTTDCALYGSDEP